MPYFHYCIVAYESKIAATEHGISTISRIVADTTLTQIQFIVNNGHLKKRRISPDS